MPMQYRKNSSGIGSIKRIGHYVLPASLHNIHHGLVQSHFDCCSFVWGSRSKTSSDKLLKLLHLAACIFTHSSYDVDSQQIN